MLSRTAQLWRFASRSSTLPRTSSPILVNYRGKKSKAKAKSANAASLSKEASLGVDLSRFEENMRKTVETLNISYSRLRTDGATPGFLDDVSVEAYGTRTALKNLAQVSVRDGRALVVSVYDEETSKAVEKAIRGAGLNLNPIAEGNGKLLVPIPKASDETRAALREVVAKDAETAKIATRMIRRKAMDEVKGLKEELSKDDIKRIESRVQTLTDRYIETISQAQENKISAMESGRGRRV